VPGSATRPCLPLHVKVRDISEIDSTSRRRDDIIEGPPTFMARNVHVDSDVAWISCVLLTEVLEEMEEGQVKTVSSCKEIFRQLSF